MVGVDDVEGDVLEAEALARASFNNAASQRRSAAHPTALRETGSNTT